MNALISHASKVMLKILQARLQQYVNWDVQAFQMFKHQQYVIFQMFKLDF